MNQSTETAQQWEQIRQALGISPEKWAAMNRAERRDAARATRRPPRDRQIRQPGRDR
jgi:hypothetical protein